MNGPHLRRAALLLLCLPPLARAQELVPAGVINGAVDKQKATFVVQDEARIARYAEQVRRQFFAAARTLTDVEAAKAALTGTDLVVYGTPASAWLVAHAARLPFRFSDGAVEVDGRKFTGAHLRVICALKSPQDPSCKAVVYAAAEAADVVGINAVFHGPTEWVVADGDRPLASGSFGALVPLTVEQQRADLEFLRATIAEVHPATLAGIPAALAAATEQAAAALQQPRPRAELWRLLQPVLLALHDAHSSLAPPNSGEALALPLTWPADGLVVRDDCGELRRGDRILALGGRDEAALLASLSAVVAAENVQWVRARGESMLADLGVLRALGVADAAPVRASIERGGATSEVDVPLGSAGARKQQAWVRFSIDKEHDLGLFTLDSCVVDKTYRDTLDEFFVAVHEQGIQRVAVDVRNNTGGNSMVVDEFLRYVAIDEFRSFGGEVRQSPHVQSQRGALSRLEGGSTPALRKNAPHKDPPPFAGQLYVLTGKRTFSSGNWFAVVVQDNKLGKVVGEATGNAPSSFGDILSFTLPHSRLSFTLSYKHWLRPDPARDPADALAPDVPVPLTRPDVLAGRDPVLDHLRQAR